MSSYQDLEREHAHNVIFKVLMIHAKFNPFSPTLMYAYMLRRASNQNNNQNTLGRVEQFMREEVEIAQCTLEP